MQLACAAEEAPVPWQSDILSIPAETWSAYEVWLTERFGRTAPMDIGVSLISYQGPYIHRSFTDETFVQIRQETFQDREEPWITRLKSPVATVRFVNPPALLQLMAELSKGTTKSASEILESVEISEFQVDSHQCDLLRSWKTWVHESEGIITLSETFGKISSTQTQYQIVLNAHDGVQLTMHSQYADLGRMIHNLAGQIIDECSPDG